MKDKVFIVIPAFNDGQVIQKVIASIKKEGFANIIVVSDGSDDDTFEKAKKEKVFFLKHIINLGQGAALQTGIDFFLQKTRGEICVTYDADGQFDSKDIRKAINFLVKNNLDVVLGSRFLGKAINISFSKKIILKLGILFTRFFSGINLTNTHNGFRVFRRKALKKIKISQNGMAHASEIIDKIVKNNLKFKEFKVTVYYKDYHKIKGQKILNSFNIIFELIFDRIFK